MNPEAMKNFMTPDELEKYIHRTLRSLPDRRAPDTLEARVLAALEARAAIPWWHKSWSYWPQSVRALFIVFCGAVATLVVAGGSGVPTDLDGAQLNHVFAPVVGFIRPLIGLGRGLVDIIAVVGRNIPAWWLYGAAAFVASLYIMLVGVGAAAYRTLWTNR
jgi:hypothetical protein